MEKRLYFAQQPNKINTFELYENGRRTGRMILSNQAKEYLTLEQLKEFKEGERIFKIPQKTKI